MMPKHIQEYTKEADSNPDSDSDYSGNDSFILRHTETRAEPLFPLKALNHFDVDFLNDGVDLEIKHHRSSLDNGDYNSEYSTTSKIENYYDNENTKVLRSKHDSIYDLDIQEGSEDEIDPDYKATEIDLDFSSDEDNDDLQELYSDIQNLVSDQKEPVNTIYDNLGNDLSSDGSLDMEYDAPASVKAKALLYIIKSSPLIIAVFALLLISNITSSNDQVALTDMGFIHHKFYVLEKKLNDLSDSQLSLTNHYDDILSQDSKSKNEIDNKLKDLELKYSSTSDQIKGFSSINSKNDELGKQIRIINNRLDSLNNVPNSSEGLENFKGYERFNANQLEIILNDIRQLQASLEDLQTWKTIVNEKFNGFNSLINDVLVENLPTLIPITERNGKIQLSAKFNDYIESLITNKSTETDFNHISWGDYVNSHKDEILNELGKNNLKFVTKDELLKDTDNIQLMFKKQLDDLQKQVETRSINSDTIDPRKLSEVIRNILDSELNNRFEVPQTKLINYGTIERGAKVNLKLTTLPKLKRLRTETFDRVRNGLFDFFRRNFLGVRRSLIGLQNIELTSQLNSPSHALSEDKSYWQCLAEDFPVLFTVQLGEPIFLQEVGISHSREVNYLLDSAPKGLQLAVKPNNKKDFKKLFTILSKSYNQDFAIKSMKGFLKIGELKYNLKSPEIYQKFPIPPKIQEILNVIEIESIMLVIESNYGNERVTALQNVRIYGLNEFEMKNSNLFLSSKPGDVGDLGDDTPY